MEQPVYYMTRGDVFKKDWVRKFLTSIKMIPVFRLRDGKDKLALNDDTFVKSIGILRNNEILLIFVEGICLHQTELIQPLKKGAPRIIQSCWQEGIPVKVLPVWIEYSSFDRFGKTIDIRIGECFGSEIATDITQASCINQINAATTNQLLELSASVPFSPVKPGVITRVLLLIPAMLGAVLHAPLYLPLQSFARKVSAGNVHYDSILLVTLCYLYPVYLLIITSILLVLSHQWWALGVFVVFPLLAKAYLHWKK
jgi:1-acyl-sn-glycerol-3-phosphate acyltransferase